MLVVLIPNIDPRNNTIVYSIDIMIQYINSYVHENVDFISYGKPLLIILYTYSCTSMSHIGFSIRHQLGSTASNIPLDKAIWLDLISRRSSTISWWCSLTSTTDFCRRWAIHSNRLGKKAENLCTASLNCSFSSCVHEFTAIIAKTE